jgi:hypothetical protein
MSIRIVTLVIVAGALRGQPLQQVEGFASILHAPGDNSRPGIAPVDFRGPATGHMS